MTADIYQYECNWPYTYTGLVLILSCLIYGLTGEAPPPEERSADDGTGSNAVLIAGVVIAVLIAGVVIAVLVVILR